METAILSKNSALSTWSWSSASDKTFSNSFVFRSNLRSFLLRTKRSKAKSSNFLARPFVRTTFRRLCFTFCMSLSSVRIKKQIFFLCQIFNYFSLIFKFAGTYYLHLLVVFKYFKVINECFCTFSALLDAPTNFVRQCLPHLSEFQKTVMNFWQRIVAHSNIFQDTDWNYFFDLTSLSTILIAQTLGHVITTGENDLKFVHDVPRDEREFLKSKLFENGLEESYPENGSLSKYFDN